MRAVRSLLEELRYSIELFVRRMLGENTRYLIELRAVRRLLEMILRYSIELRVVRSLLGEM